MLEKPDIADELIISRLQEEYELNISQLTFLPLGADMGTVVYRLVTEDRTAYFLKLRRGFEEIIVKVPLFLKSQGVREVIAPLQTKSKRGWADFGEYKMILYPFIKGKDSFDGNLSDDHKRELGAALKRIHTTKIPPELDKLIPKENFTAYWRERWKDIQQQVEKSIYDDPTAAKLAEFIKSKRREISHLVKRTEELASELKSKFRDLVLCHTDIHGANVLIADNGELYIVDWDNPLLAPKERDLMFIGGGIDHIWKSEQDEDVFYEGYGKTNIDFAVLAYYRYERVIEDLVAYGEQLLLTDEGGADRESGYWRFISNFEPGSTIEIAEKTDPLLS
jgi:spectinomycin phosphotransferase